MKVPALPANAAMASTKSATEAASSDPQHFTRLLDEKRQSAATCVRPAGGGLPQARFHPSAQQATSPAAEPPDNARETSADNTDASLLAMLKPFHVSNPQDDLTKKEKLTLAQENDPQPDALPGVVSAAALKTTDAGLPVNDSLPADAIQHEAPESRIALVTREAGPLAVPELTLAAAPAPAPVAKPALPHPVQPGAASLAEQPAAIMPSLPESRSLKAVTLPAGHNLMPVKQGGIAKGGEQDALRPGFTLTAPGATQQASLPATASASATGLLTQEMGTPAWQQSLGQQVACFTRNGIQHAELRLHPEELGSLQISLQLKNEQAQLHFVSASHQVRAAIEAAVPHLRTSLAESGIELGQSSVGADPAQNGNDPGQSGQSPRQNVAHSHGSDNDHPAEETTEIVVRTVSYNNGINTFA